MAEQIKEKNDWNFGKMIKGDERLNAYVFEAADFLAPFFGLDIMKILPDIPVADFFDKYKRPKINAPRINNKNLTPNISDIVPENITGITVIAVETNQKFPKTLPRNPPGVISCIKVVEGIAIPTKLPVKANIVKLPTRLLNGCCNSGMINTRINIPIIIVSKAYSMTFLFLQPLWRSLGTNNAPRIAPIAPGYNNIGPTRSSDIAKIS